MRISIIYLFAFIFLAASCTKEHNTITIEEEEPVEAVTNIQLSTLIITVDIEETFTCTINDQIYINENPGVIIIEDLLLNKKGALIFIESDGYFDEPRYVIPSIGAHAYINVEMTPLNGQTNFKAEDGGSISFNKLEIEIGPNVIKDSQGNDYEGDVNVSLKNTFSAAYASEIRRFPQNLIVADDKLSMLHILDGYHIEIRDNMQNPLFVKEGFTTNIKVKIFSEPNIPVPEILEIRNFDVSKEKWEIIGSVEKNGEWWHGIINNFGMINFGIPTECRPVQVKLKTADDLILPNQFAFISMGMSTPFSLGYSDSKGNLRIHAPVDSEFHVVAYEYNPPDVFKRKEYSPIGLGEEDILVLEDLTFSQGLYQNFSGNIVDCNDQTIKNGALVLHTNYDFSNTENDSYIFSNDEGLFNFALRKGQWKTKSVKLFDLNTNTSSKEFHIPNVNQDKIDFSNLSFCSEFNSYINYNVNDQLQTYPFNGQFSSTFIDPKYELTFSADALQNAGDNNRISFTIEHTTDQSLFSGHTIKELNVSLNNGQNDYSFECSDDCQHRIDLTNITTDFYEGQINYIDNTNTSVIVGTFRLPRQ